MITVDNICKILHRFFFYTWNVLKLIRLLSSFFQDDFGIIPRICEVKKNSANYLKMLENC